LATSASPTLDAAALGRFLDGPHAKVREEVREWLSREGNAPQPDLPLTEHRRQVLGWTKDLASTDRTHQRRLLIPLAGTYELHFAQEQLVGSMAEAFTGDGADDRQRRKLETSAAALKATGTWHASATIQECREAVGGQGYLKANRLAALKADTDVFTTFEGDNTVLLQLAAKNLLTDFQDEFGSSTRSAPSVRGRAGGGRGGRAHCRARAAGTIEGPESRASARGHALGHRVDQRRGAARGQLPAPARAKRRGPETGASGAAGAARPRRGLARRGLARRRLARRRARG
jgi:hypothetical protein